MADGPENAEQLLRVADRLRREGFGVAAADVRPIAWDALTPEEAPAEWASLRGWVERLVVRFPHGVRLPDCWYRNNDLVEALSALRDYERLCYSGSASASGPVDWHRAFREIEARIEMWSKRFTCAVPGREHDGPSQWSDFVAADVALRRNAQEGGAETVL
jgi:hypothetical protein